MSARLALETSAARLVGRLSRATGRGGGTTLPGKLVWKLDPTALDALAARLPAGVALVSATNGKTTTTAMASAILAPSRRLAWNRSGANLASGVTSTLLTARDATLLSEWQVYRMVDVSPGAWSAFQYLLRERLLEEGVDVRPDGTVDGP